MNDKPNVLPQGALRRHRHPGRPSTAGSARRGPRGTQFKAAVVYPLWWQFQASANYQNLPPIATVGERCGPQRGRSCRRSAAVSSACGTRVPCTSHRDRRHRASRTALHGAAVAPARSALQPYRSSCRAAGASSRSSTSTTSRTRTRSLTIEHAVGAVLEQRDGHPGRARAPLRRQHELLIQVSRKYGVA